MNAIFADFLKELAKATHFSDLKPDQQGSCLLEFKNEKLHILFEYDDSLVPNTIIISTEIADYSKELIADVLEECLIGNYMIEETLSSQPNEATLFLHRRVHPQIDATEILAILESFLIQAQKWRQKIHEMSKQPSKKLRIPIPPSQINVFPFKG